jgi:phospholipid N-methyltransferase
MPLGGTIVNGIIRDFKAIGHHGTREAQRRANGVDPELALFLGCWLKAPHRIGALAPSSRYLAQAMARQVDIRQARLVIELGGGTGSITRALLAAGLAPERLVVVEREERLHRRLVEQFPGLRVLRGDAAQLVALLRPLGITSASAIVSSLPLLSMPKRLRHRIVDQSFGAVHLWHRLAFAGARLRRLRPRRGTRLAQPAAGLRLALRSRRGRDR